MIPPEPKEEDDLSPESDDDLSSEEIEILAALGNTEDQCLELEEISDAVDLSNIRARHYLDVLEQLRLVDHIEDPMCGYVYSLTSEGRRFVIENDLVD